MKHDIRSDRRLSRPRQRLRSGLERTTLWSPTPILEVWYDGGARKQGVGYIDAYAGSGIARIFGANRVATRFTVAGS